MSSWPKMLCGLFLKCHSAIRNWMVFYFSSLFSHSSNDINKGEGTIPKQILHEGLVDIIEYFGFS